MSVLYVGGTPIFPFQREREREREGELGFSRKKNGNWCELLCMCMVHIPKVRRLCVCAQTLRVPISSRLFFWGFFFFFFWTFPICSKLLGDSLSVDLLAHHLKGNNLKKKERKKNPPKEKQKKKKTLWFLIIPEANNPVVFGAPCSPVYIAALVFDSLNSARH